MWSASIIGWVRSLGKVLIEALGDGAIDIRLLMGRTGNGPGFCLFGVSRIYMEAGFGNIVLCPFFLWWMVASGL